MLQLARRAACTRKTGDAPRFGTSVRKSAQLPGGPARLAQFRIHGHGEERSALLPVCLLAVQQADPLGEGRASLLLCLGPDLLELGQRTFGLAGQAPDLVEFVERGQRECDAGLDLR